MENPFRRRAAFALARLLSEIIAHCQHVIRVFCVSALPDTRGEVVETPPRRRRGLDASGEPMLVGRPRREGAGREPVRQQADQGVHDVSETLYSFLVELRPILYVQV